MTQTWALFNLTANEQTKELYTTHKQPRWRYPLSVNRQMKWPSNRDQARNQYDEVRPPGASDNRREINEQAAYNSLVITWPPIALESNPEKSMNLNWSEFGRVRTGSDWNLFENWQIRTGSDWGNFFCLNVIIHSPFLVVIRFDRFDKFGKCQKRQRLFCLMRQKHRCSYFAFSQTWLLGGKIIPAVLLPYEAK